MPTTSQTSDSLFLTSAAEFSEQIRQSILDARRHIRILSHQLDPAIYDQPSIVEALSAFARQSREAKVKILVRDSDEIIERSHRLAALVRRLPTKLALRKLVLEPNNQSMAFALADTRTLVYQNEDGYYAGFANTNAAAQVKSLSEMFDDCWEKAQEEPRLRMLYI